MSANHAGSSQQAERRRPARRPLRQSLALIIDYSIMIGLAGFFLFPIVFMVVSSFKPEKLIFDDLKTVLWAFIPREITFENFSSVFRRVPFGRFMFNSTFIVLATVSAGLVVNSMVAFALARLALEREDSGSVAGDRAVDCAAGCHRRAPAGLGQRVSLDRRLHRLAGYAACANRSLHRRRLFYLPLLSILHWHPAGFR